MKSRSEKPLDYMVFSTWRLYFEETKMGIVKELETEWDLQIIFPLTRHGSPSWIHGSPMEEETYVKRSYEEQCSFEGVTRWRGHMASRNWPCILCRIYHSVGKETVDGYKTNVGHNFISYFWKYPSRFVLLHGEIDGGGSAEFNWVKNSINF